MAAYLRFVWVMFMMIDILTLFIRLSYQGVVEDCFEKKAGSGSGDTKKLEKM